MIDARSPKAIRSALTASVPAEVVRYYSIEPGEVLNEVPIVETLLNAYCKEVGAWVREVVDVDKTGLWVRVTSDGYICDECFHYQRNDYGCPCNHDGCYECNKESGWFDED